MLDILVAHWPTGFVALYGNVVKLYFLHMLCSETTCPPPFKSQYKMMISCQVNLTYGHSCNFSCEPGYNRIGPDSITCERNDSTPKDGFWSEDPPQCDGEYEVCFVLYDNLDHY